MSKWIFVIDTDSYAGNFEREMCAYITGVTGECEVGKEFSEIYKKETGEEESRFFELLEQVPDDHGCHRPTESWETKDVSVKNEYNSVAIFFLEKPTPEDIAFMKERALKFAETKRKNADDENISYEKNFKLKITGFRLLQEITTVQEFQI